MEQEKREVKLVDVVQDKQKQSTSFGKVKVPPLRQTSSLQIRR